MKVVFHADDFGLTSAVNAGILEAHERGVLGSTSLMVTGLAAEEAARAAKATPGLDVGLHLTLVEEQPVLPPSRIPTLVDDGRFWPRHPVVALRYLLGRWEPAEARAELAAQWERFSDFGLVPSHCDGHQHLHMLPGVLPAVSAEARRRGVRCVRREFGDPLRGGDALRVLSLVAIRAVSRLASRQVAPADLEASIVFTTVGFLQSGGTLTRPRLLETLRGLQRKSPAPGVVEVMLHPGHQDAETRRRYGHWGYAWERDLALLLDPVLPDQLAGMGVEVTSFRELAAQAPRSFAKRSSAE